MTININLIYIIVGAIAFLVCGLIAGLIIALVMMRKAMTKEQKAEAINEINKFLRNLIVGAENKFKPLVNYLAQLPTPQKAGEIKEAVVKAEAIKFIEENKLPITDEELTPIIKSLVTFMNKKIEAKEENKAE